MTWVSILNLILQLGVLLARRAERQDIEKALTVELEKLHGKHVDAAVAARERVTPDSLPNDRNPNQRD